VSGSGGIKKVAAEGRCRTCPATSATAEISRHHLVPQSWFYGHPGVKGCNARANIVPLCLRCHRIVDGSRASVARRLKRCELRETLTREEVAFVEHVRGRGWLDHHYPLWVVTHADPHRLRVAYDF
jgi:hypothetical protein